MFGVACCRKAWEKALYDEAHGARIVGSGGRETVNRKKAFSSIFTTDTKSFIHVTRIAALHIILTFICLRATSLSYDVATAPSDRDVRTRLAASRVDLGIRYVTVCVLQEGVGGSFQ
jgi:hypothetical protein